MPITPEVQERKRTLELELNEVIKSCRPKALGNYYISLILMIVAVSASVIAGIGGLTKSLPSELIGILALIPGAISLLVSQMKFQDKSNFHYRRLYKFEVLRSRLQLQLAEAPTANDIAALARERDALADTLNKEWEERFSFNFTPFENKKLGAT